MQYVIGGLLIFVGLINVNLIRVGIETGKVQSRMFAFDRTNDPSKFWVAIVIQALVSALLFALGITRIAMG
jgi:hypothetical protein